MRDQLKEGVSACPLPRPLASTLQGKHDQIKIMYIYYTPLQPFIRPLINFMVKSKKLTGSFVDMPLA